MYKGVLAILLSCLFWTACKKNENIKTIGENEYYFNEKLSSIMVSDNGSLFIGTENGEIIDVIDNKRKSFDLNEDRIYKMLNLTDSIQDTTLWVGIRNSGIQKWKKSINGNYDKLKTYKIDFKNERYSPYDFLIVGDRMYIATSQGLYTINVNNQLQDKLELVYPSFKFLSRKNGTTFVVHNTVAYKDSLVLASSQDGALWHNISTGETSVTESNRHIEHVSIYNDTVFILSSDTLFLRNIQGENIGTIKLNYAPKVHYQIQGIHYFIGSDEILLTDDLVQFYTFRLKNTIPTNGRNLIVSDKQNLFTYLITDKSIWRISNNINIFKSNKSIKASCSDNNCIYYLSNENELYMQNIGEGKAHWLYTFPHENQIKWIDVVDNDLYFYNHNNEYQKITIASNWLYNSFFNHPKTIYKSDAKITTAQVKSFNNKLTTYLGIQDGAIMLDKDGVVDSISELNDKYLTSMFGHKGSERLYISTLNSGVYYIRSKDEVHVVPETDSLPFINDIIATDEHQANLIILTNKEIISQASNDSIKAKGYKKLIYVNDTLFYALPEFGIQKFRIIDDKIINCGTFYEDIRFDKNSSFTVGNKLILVSNVGALNLEIDDENSAEWILFDKAKNINIVEVFLFCILLLLLSIITTIIIKRKRQLKINSINNSRNDLLKRLEDISLYYNVLDDLDNEDIAKLKKRINSIVPKADTSKELLLELDQYSLQIGKLNRKIALRIHNKLEIQITTLQQVDAYEKSQLLEKSIEVAKYEDIEPIKDQIKVNEKWLIEREELLKSIEINKNRLNGCLEIEGINKNLYNNILNIENELPNQPLKQIIKLYSEKEAQIENINSMSTLGIIKQYIEQVDNYFKTKIEIDSNLLFVEEELDIIKKSLDEFDNLSLLKALDHINDNYLILQILDKINSQTKRYRAIVEKINEENNEQINKKFEKELSAIINEQTMNETKAIQTQISKLYSILQRTDFYVVSNMLKLSNTDGQYAKVLALLIANPKVKRTLIPGMLGVYGNLNPVVSRLINDRIKVHEEELKDLQKHNDRKSLLIYFILKLID